KLPIGTRISSTEYYNQDESHERRNADPREKRDGLAAEAAEVFERAGPDEPHGLLAEFLAGQLDEQAFQTRLGERRAAHLTRGVDGGEDGWQAMRCVAHRQRKLRFVSLHYLDAFQS